MAVVTQSLNLAKILLEEIERNLNMVQEGQLLYYKQILMYTLYALGYAVDALIYSRLRVRPSGHNDRLFYLAQLGRQDLKQLYEKLIVLVFSKLETVSSLRVSDLRSIVNKVKEAIAAVEAELSGSQHV